MIPGAAKWVDKLVVSFTFFLFFSFLLTSQPFDPIAEVPFLETALSFVKSFSFHRAQGDSLLQTLLLFPLIKLFGISEIASRMLSAFCGALGCLLCYQGAKETFGKETAVVAALFQATTLLYFLKAFQASPLMLQSLCFSASLYFYIRATATPVAMRRDVRGFYISLMLSLLAGRWEVLLLLVLTYTGWMLGTNKKLHFKNLYHPKVLVIFSIALSCIITFDSYSKNTIISLPHFALRPWGQYMGAFIGFFYSLFPWVAFANPKKSSPIFYSILGICFVASMLLSFSTHFYLMASLFTSMLAANNVVELREENPKDMKAIAPYVFLCLLGAVILYFMPFPLERSPLLRYMSIGVLILTASFSTLIISKGGLRQTLPFTFISSLILLLTVNTYFKTHQIASPKLVTSLIGKELGPGKAMITLEKIPGVSLYVDTPFYTIPTKRLTAPFWYKHKMYRKWKGKKRIYLLLLQKDYDLAVKVFHPFYPLTKQKNYILASNLPSDQK